MAAALLGLQLALLHRGVHHDGLGLVVALHRPGHHLEAVRTADLARLGLARSVGGVLPAGDPGVTDGQEESQSESYNCQSIRACS